MNFTWSAKLICALGALVASAATVTTAAAEEPWPTARTIRVIVPAGAGAGTDLIARAISAHLDKALKQTLVIENKSGANGLIGNAAVAKAPADGYTLLFSNASSVAINPAVQTRMPYDTMKDLQPVAQIGMGGVILVVTPKFPAKDMKSFVSYVKARPGEFVYGTWGIGSTGHLSMEALKAQAGLRLTHVPYRTMGQLMTELQGDVLRIAFVDAVSSLPLIKSGRLVALGITGTVRAPELPDLPTTAELGYKLGADGWYGLFVPAGTPDAIVQRLNAETNRALKDPQLGPVLTSMNMATPPIKTAAEFTQTLRDDLKIWREIAVAGKIAVNTAP